MKIVAIKEMSNGNDSVGNMWLETKIFDAQTPVIEILMWAGDLRITGNRQIISQNCGKLIITIPAGGGE